MTNSESKIGQKIFKTRLNNDLGLEVIITDSWTSYTGTRDELIEEGICTADQFPDGKKRIKDNYHEHGQWDGHWSIKCVKGKKYDFTIYGKKEPTPKRDIQYNSPISWKYWVGGIVLENLDFLKCIVTGESERLTFGEATICFDNKSKDRILDAISELNLALTQGNTFWTVKAKNTHKQSAEAKKDKSFQSVMRAIIQD